jgi:hypothetical protein
MKQTAVEWLIEELRGDIIKGDFIYNGVITSELIDQAKEMEKEQIMDAYIFGLQDEYVIGSQQYYNKTFKQQSVTDDTL